jgi:hypothetical protein
MTILKSFALAVSLAFAAVPVCAQTPAPTADPTGTWNATFNTQNGAIPAQLKLQKSGDKLTGTILGGEATSAMPVEAKVAGNTLTCWFTYQPSGSDPIPIEMTGTITGDTAKGTMMAGGQPSGDWSATRQKDAKDAKEPKDTKAASAPASLTGDWSVTLQLDTVTATPSVVLKQDGEKLTGDYTSQQYGKFPLTGTVKGSDVTFSVSLNIEGNSITGVYTGTVQPDGSIKGTVNIADQMSGTFTAVRKK